MRYMKSRKTRISYVLSFHSSSIMLDLKPEVDTVEYSERETIERNHTSHHDAIVVQGIEDEPGNVYQLSWKTIVAFISLSMANSCTAITNTVGTFHGLI